MLHYQVLQYMTKVHVSTLARVVNHKKQNYKMRYWSLKKPDTIFKVEKIEKEIQEGKVKHVITYSRHLCYIDLGMCDSLGYIC